jgi:hypothetical protein
MKLELNHGEQLVKKSGANMMRGIESVGGMLYLTDQRLVFVSHAMNIQTGSSAINLTDVVEVSKSWTKFLNAIPIMPNSISVLTHDQQIFQFVVFGRKHWITAIEAAIASRN